MKIFLLLLILPLTACSALRPTNPIDAAIEAQCAREIAAQGVAQ
jgi:hypothetical protein